MAKKVKIFSIKDGHIPSDFVHSAVDHLTAAQALFETNPSHYDSAGYIAHIGVELLLKAWLLELAGEFEGVHRLEVLYSALAAKHGAPQLTQEQTGLVQTLDQFEQLRYPNRKQPIEVGDEHWAEIKEFVGFICRSMPEAIPAALDQAEFGRKGGRVLMQKKNAE